MKLFKKVVAGLLIGAMIMTCTACGQNSTASKTQKSIEIPEEYSQIIDTLCDAKINADPEKFLSVFGAMEDLMSQVVTQEVMDKTKATYVESCGDNLSYSYIVTAKEDVSEEDLATYKEVISMFGSSGKIEQACNVHLTVTVEGKKGDYEYDMVCPIGKVNGEWMIVNINDTLLK